MNALRNGEICRSNKKIKKSFHSLSNENRNKVFLQGEEKHLFSLENCSDTNTLNLESDRA